MPPGESTVQRASETEEQHDGECDNHSAKQHEECVAPLHVLFAVARGIVHVRAGVKGWGYGGGWVDRGKRKVSVLNSGGPGRRHQKVEGSDGVAAVQEPLPSRATLVIKVAATLGGIVRGRWACGQGGGAAPFGEPGFELTRSVSCIPHAAARNPT